MKNPKEAHESESNKESVKFTSGGVLSEKEFHDGIDTAEDGPFYTVRESMNRFEKWLKERKKK